MHQFKFVFAILVSIILAGCGGGGSDLPPAHKFTSHVSFGDSLSDVGTYNVGFVAAAGGGQFSINGPNANGKAANGNNIVNWTEAIAMNLGLDAPCPVVTGLVGVGADAASSVAVTTPNLACTGYAQGGARVTALNGIHNAANGMYSTAGGLGGAELTYPVVKQIANFITDHTSFSGNELVSVVVGGNDIKYNLTMVGAGALSAASAVQAMGTAAGELVNDVNTQLLANGAKYVVVASIPDFADIPAISVYPAQTRGLVDLMVTTFNSTLQAGLAALPGSANVIYLDTYTSIKDEITNPAKYGLTNVTTQACDPFLTPNDRALFCNASTLKTGLTVDSHYLFSDDTHPTPYGHALFAQYVLQALTAKGWH